MEHFHACFFSPIGAAAEFSPKNEATGMTPGGFAVLFGRFFPLLQVSSGCSYNKCAFCFVRDGASFCASPLDGLQKDLAEMGRLRGASMKSMGPLNGDPSGFPPSAGGNRSDGSSPAVGVGALRRLGFRPKGASKKLPPIERICRSKLQRSLRRN